ncbi:hypothetical protein KC867_00080 [Candidatus Saccharibacteria bacterium]|nr:hypothetical protein [Candidatus Saccharibacteria bacterium]
MEYDIFEVNRNCTSDAESCVMPLNLVIEDCFVEQVSDPDNLSTVSTRLMLGSLFDACMNGNCPGVRLEIWVEVLRQKRSDS